MARKAGKGVTLTVTGIKEVDRKLRKLGPAVQKKVVRAAMRKGMNLVTKQARENAPVKTGALKKAIKTRSGKVKKGVIRVETRVGAGDFKGDTFYGAFVEFGTSKVPPQPFMTPAFMDKGDGAKKVAVAAILAGIEREAKGGKAAGGAAARGGKGRSGKPKAKALRKTSARPKAKGGGPRRDSRGRFIKG